MILALTLVVWITESWDVGFLALVGVVFMIVFMIGQAISFLIAKSKTEKMNDALKIFLKEHEEDEKE